MFALGAVVDSAYARDSVLLLLALPIDPDSIPTSTDFSLLEDGTTPLGIASVTHVFTDTGLGVLELQLDDPIPDADRSITLTYAHGDAPITSARDGSVMDGFEDLAVALLLPSDSATGLGSASTAADGGPTAADPVGTTVTSPNDGLVTINETSVSVPPPTGYTFFGQQVEISAPAASNEEDPLVLRFQIDASVVMAGQDENSVEVFRDGVLVPECTEPGVADPPPCVSGRQPLGEGDIEITVLTLEASAWNFGIIPPFEFSGFQAPVDADVANVVNAGQAIPVKFSLGDDRGLDIFEGGTPSVLSVDCTTAEGDVVEQTVTAGSSSLTYDPATDTYTYVWKTSKDWEGSCRRLVLDFVDGSSATALFDFRR